MSLVENEERLRQAVRQVKRCLSEAEVDYAEPAQSAPV